MWRTVILASLLVACGTKETAGSDEHPEAKTRPALKSGKELFGPKLALPAVVSRIALGATREEAAAAAPEVLAEKYIYQLPGYDRVEIMIDIFDKTDRVYSIRVAFPEPLETLKGWLASWGEPRVITSETGIVTYWWIDLDNHLCVEAHSTGATSQLSFTEAMSFVEYLGVADGRFGWEIEPVIGMTSAQLFAVYERWGAHHHSPGKVQFTPPSTEVSDVITSTRAVLATLVDDKVVGYQVDIYFEWDPAMKEVTLARLEEMSGKPTTANDGYLVYPGPPKVTARPGDDHVSVWVGAR